MSFRNKKRKIISFAAGFSAIILTAVSTPVFISFAEETSENSPVKSSEKSPEKTSGKCGNNASWSYSGGTLSISGSGEMYDYQSDYQPWINLSDEITSVNISGVSYIGAYNFSNISNLSYAYISESVESIDSNAFSKSASLTLEVKKGGYAEMYAEYAGINYKTYGSSDTDESYEKLTNPKDANDKNAIGGVDNAETNSAKEIETDKKGNIVIVPYAGAADANIMPDGGVAANGVIVEDITESTESTPETETSQTSPAYDDNLFNKGNEVSKISWTLSDGVLTISGNGNMDTYSDITTIPWFSRRKEIIKIVVSDGITRISSYSFAQCFNLEEISLPSTLYNVDDHAFYNCEKLKKVSIPSSVLKIGEQAFGYLYSEENNKAETDKDYTIYGETDSEAEKYAEDNGIKFIQKIQKNDTVIPENEASTKLSFRFKLIAVTTAAVVIAFISGIIFYVWQRKGGIEKLKEKENSKNKKWFTMKYIVYNTLSDDAKNIRTKVFVEEQGFENEFDEIDNSSFHIVSYTEKNEPAAVCRIFKGTEKNSYILGRLAVLKQFRGKNLGTEMIKTAEKIVKEKGGNSISLHAQCRVSEFYKKIGYSSFGNIDYDEDCPHIWMKKDI